MNPETEDFVTKRLESHIQVIHGLLKDFTEKHVQAVDEKMDEKFNHKMETVLAKHDAFRKENQDMYVALKQTVDTIDMKVNTLTKDTEPLVEGKKAASSIFKFLLWTAPVAIIWGAIKWVLKL